MVYQYYFNVLPKDGIECAYPKISYKDFEGFKGKDVISDYLEGYFNKTLLEDCLILPEDVFYVHPRVLLAMFVFNKCYNELFYVFILFFKICYICSSNILQQNVTMLNQISQKHGAYDFSCMF